MGMTTCKDCGKEVSETAQRCPHCGKYLWHGGRIGFAIIILIFFFLFMIGMCSSISQAETKNKSSTQKNDKPTFECPAKQCYMLKTRSLIILNAAHAIKLSNLIEKHEDEIAVNYLMELEKNKYAYSTDQPFIVYKIDKMNSSQHLYAYKLKTIDGTVLGWLIEEQGLKRIK